MILAHYYVEDAIQDIADEIGGLVLSEQKGSTDRCGYHRILWRILYGESAKILNPGKKVLMPDATADCAMAHMVNLKQLQEIKDRYDDLAVVCYINLHGGSQNTPDVCVTSANAVKIVRKLPNQNIFFIPDGNLGRYVAEQVPEKNVMLNDGYCPIHAAMTREAVLLGKGAHPEAAFLVHPECTRELLEEADYIGSTSGIIQYASESDRQEFLIGTEIGVFCELKKRNPEKQFYTSPTSRFAGI